MFKPFVLFTAIILAISATCLAQAPKVTLSEGFDEPTSGAVRLLLMKNGTTLYFHFTPSDGINVTVYNDHQQQKAKTTLTSTLWGNGDDMKRSELKGLYEINGQAVIFLLQITHKIPCFYRIIVDAETGKVSQEDKIAELPTGGYNGINAAAKNQPELHNFYIEKDPESDYYATVQSDYRGDDKSKRLLVTHYAPNHQEINRAYFELPGTTFKNTDYQAFSVHRDEYVFLVTYGNNGGRTKDAKLVMATLNKGSNKFRTQIIDWSQGFDDPLSGIQYDPANQLVRLLTATNAYNMDVKDHDQKRVAYFYIDPVKFKIIHSGFIENSYINTYAKEKLQYKHDYEGEPQNFTINPDGTCSIMLEEREMVRHQNNFTTIELQDIGIATIDTAGRETDGFAISKAQNFDDFFGYWQGYQYNRGAWSFRLNSAYANKTLAPFFSYQYLHPLNREYVLFNDYTKNIHNESESYHGKKLVTFISGSSTVCYCRKNGQLQKYFLYGDPGDHDIDRYTYLEATVHTPDQQKIATLMIERDGHKDPVAHVAWIDFQ